MKRAKRDKAEHAYKLGYNQGIKGHDKGMCPYANSIDAREQWMGGWRKGHYDWVQGYRTEEFF